MNFKKLYLKSQIEMQDLIAKQLNPSVINNFNKKAYQTMLQSKDKILCANRYLWTGLNVGITTQQMESLFYENGSLVFFVKNGKLKITKFQLGGKLDLFGRLDELVPIDFSGKKYPQIKGVMSSSGLELKNGVGVIIPDYTTSYSEGIATPRAELNRTTTINDQVNVYVQLANNINLSIKKALALCENESQRNVMMKQIAELLSNNSPIVAVSTKSGEKGIADVPIELFNFDKNFDTQNYCQTIDFYDKIRRQFNGIPSPDTFEKKERKITSETENVSAHTDIVLYDGLMTRFLGLLMLKKAYPNIKEIQDIDVCINPILKG